MRWTKEEAIKEYQKARKKHGEKAKSSTWLNHNGYSRLVAYISITLKGWAGFRKCSEINEELLYGRWNKDKVIKEYRRLRKKYGEKGRNSNWLVRNGHKGLAHYAKRTFSGWDNFKKQAGFSEEPLRISWTKDLAIKKYKDLRRKYGDKAKSSSWVRENGCGRFYECVSKKLKLPWDDFKKLAGFDEQLRISWTKELAIKEYRNVRKKYGDKAKSSLWIYENGYRKLLTYVEANFERWDDFKKLAGFDEDSLYVKRNKKDALRQYRRVRKLFGEKAESSVWMNKNGHGGLISYAHKYFGWVDFKKEAGFTPTKWNKEKIVKEYRKIRKKYGDKAKSTAWMGKNKYSFLVRYACQNFKSWSLFKKWAGFSDGWSKAKSVKEYQKLRKLYGDQAKMSQWLDKNGHSGLRAYIGRHFESWDHFKKQAGFNDVSTRTIWCKTKAIQRYRGIRNKHGDKAKNSRWMQQNGYGGILAYLRRNFGIWRNFLDFYNYSYNMTEEELRTQNN